MITESVQSAAEAAVNNNTGDDLQEAIKNITLSAIRDRKLTKPELKAVFDQVLSGVASSVGDSQTRLEPAIEDSLKGIDNALAETLNTSKVLLDDILVNSESFINKDVKGLINELNKIEDLMFESVSDVFSNKLNKQQLSELFSRFKNTGTMVGDSVKLVVKSLNQALETAAKQGITEVSHLSKDLVINLAKSGSGILAGVAEAMRGTKTK